MRRIVSIAAFIVLAGLAIWFGWWLGTTTGNGTLGVIVSIVLYLAAAGGWVIWQTASNRRATRLLRTGKPGEATILRSSRTGLIVLGSSQIELWLDVRPAEGAPFQARADVLAGFGQVQKFAVGQVVRVKYDPANTSVVAVE